MKKITLPRLSFCRAFGISLVMAAFSMGSVISANAKTFTMSMTPHFPVMQAPPQTPPAKNLKPEKRHFPHKDVRPRHKKVKPVQPVPAPLKPMPQPR